MVRLRGEATIASNPLQRPLITISHQVLRQKQRHEPGINALKIYVSVRQSKKERPESLLPTYKKSEGVKTLLYNQNI